MKIIEALKLGEKSVGELCDEINEEQSKVSHNLKKLKKCNFLEVKQDGKKRVYSLNKDTIVPLLNLVEEHVKKYCKMECHKNESIS